MWMNFSPSPRRSEQPFWCIRHEESAETMYCAPLRSWSRTLSMPIRADTGSSLTQKVPPKPQHSSGRSGRMNTMPLTLDSSASGFEKNGSGPVR
jgi:hypothetical protein